MVQRTWPPHRSGNFIHLCSRSCSNQVWSSDCTNPWRTMACGIFQRSNSVRFQEDIEEADFTPRRRALAGHDFGKLDKDSTHSILPQRELSRVFSEDYDKVQKTILDPRGNLVIRWQRIFFTACLISLFIDPLFLIVPTIKDDMCIHVSHSLQAALTAIRTVIDLFYVINILVQFRTAYVAPSSRIFGRGDLVVDPSKIAARYLRKEFWLDSLAAQPVPQILIWAVVPNIRGTSFGDTRNIVRIIFMVQYLLRFYLIFPLGSKINNATGAGLQTAWGGAAYNLMMFILAGHILGCLYYHLVIQRQEDCWRNACSLERGDCYHASLLCSHMDVSGTDSWYVSSNVTNLCDPDNGFFEFGIYGEALGSGIMQVNNLFTRFYYCLWWALRNVLCLGQNMETSTFLGEINYAMFLGIVSMLLFSFLVANMTTYLQTATNRMEQWRMMKNDTERWMHHRQLPHELRHCVRRYNQLKWSATRGVDEEAILLGLPLDLQRVIKRHLCLDLVRKVPLFDMMDEQMLDAICQKLKPCLYHKGTCLVREGDPVIEMLFIIRGRLQSYTTGGGRTGFFNSCLIGPGDFCGEELLTWGLDPRSTVILPSSTRTVIAIDDVEAFAFSAEDLTLIAAQFRRLNSKKLRQVFRYHSPQWRTWAASFIQAAWCRYRKRKEAAKLKRINSMPGMEKTPAVLQAASSFTNYVAKLAASSRRCGPKPEDPDFEVEK